ncbi:neprilysin-2-like [Amblyomma americanum]
MSTSTWKEAPPSGLGPRVWSLLGALAAAVLLTVVLISVLSLVVRRPRDAETEVQKLLITCQSAGCFEYEGLLRDTLNTSVDPCQDFKAFVTSRWLPTRSREVDTRWSMQWNVKYRWARMLADEIRLRRFKVPAMNIVATSYAACANREGEDAERTRTVFKQLLRNLSIPWPEVPVEPVDKLDVLFNLFIKWDIPLWFSVKVLPEKTAAGEKIIRLGRSSYIDFWITLYREMDTDSKIHAYVQQFVKYFSFPLASEGVSAPKIDYYQVFNITRSIVYALKLLCASSPREYTVETLTKQMRINTSRWISLMNKYFHPNESFSPADKVFAKPDSVNYVAHTLNHMYNSSVIRSHLGWWVLQIFAPLADNLFFITKYGTEAAADTLRPLFCQVQTEHSFKLLVLANHVALNFPPSVRSDVDQLLNGVRETAAAYYEASNVSKYVNIARKLRQMKINLWPGPEYLSKDVLARIYAQHCTDERTTLEHWIAERKANARFIGTDAYFESTRLAHSFSDKPFVYDSLLNTITVSMLGVHAPFYYTGGIEAANYGGLGAAFLKAVLQGINYELRIEDDLRYNSGEDDEGLGHITVGCKGSRNVNRKSLSHVLRFFEARKTETKPSNIWSYPPEAFFFISYCHTQSRLDFAFDCNDELRGVQSFVDAFRCPRGSGMNP